MAAPKKKPKAYSKKKKPKQGFKNLAQFMGTPDKKSPPKEKVETKQPPPPKKAVFLDEKREKTSEPTPQETTKPGEKALPDPLPSQKHTPKTNPLQKQFFDTNPHPFGDAKYPQVPPRESREALKSWHIRILQSNHEIVQDMKEGILLTVDYDGGTNKAFAKFYDLSDQSIKMWIDTTGHQPYCYSKTSEQELEQFDPLLDHAGFDEMKTVKKIDLLTDREIDVTQVFGFSPTDIGGANGFRDVLDGAWEARIRYHHSYIYDTKLIPGMSYSIAAGKVTQLPPKIDQNLERQLLELFKSAPNEITEMAKNYHPIFSTPSLPVKRLAYDIEVAETAEGVLPNPMLAKWEVISISFAATDGLKLVYVLDREDMERGIYPEDFPEDAQVYFFKSEKELLRESFRIFWQYPIIITFNGDNFDNTYLYHRARRLKLGDTENPIYVGRGGGMISHNTDFKHSIHLDVFQFFANRSIKGYAFGGAYVRNSLEQVASSLLGAGKVKHEGVLIGKMTLADLVHYNLQDSLLTLELTTFNSNLVWDLIITLMRVTKLPFQDLFRLQISAWIRSLMYAEHRWKNYLIPRMSELETRGNFNRENTNKFKGAYVIDPIPGAHYNVAVLDFSSLYPSIIKTKNLSYETVKCVHAECRDNLLPDSPHWTCTKKMGVFAYVVGYLRDVRVNWFKPLSSDPTISKSERQSAKTMAAALKVFINGAYGVFGSPIFPFYYRPVAEATTTIGRYSIQQTIDKATALGVQVLYGDTDSVFLAHPTPDQVQALIEWSTIELDLDLELEKTYQFLALSARKKNYIGVHQGGKQVDLKGLMAKKKNTPDFIKHRFAKVQNILTQIVDDDSFAKRKKQIIKIVSQTNKLIGHSPEKGGFSLEDYAITTVIRKKKYTVKPQHVKAAEMDKTTKYEQGSYVTFIKARSKEGVKPLSQASLHDLDIPKYKKLVRSTFEQVLDALGISYEDTLGIKKLSSFF